MEFRTTCVALDGGRVDVSASSPFLSGFSSVGLAELPTLKRSNEFTAGPLELGKQIAVSPEIGVGMTFNSELSLAGGRLLLGTGDQPVGPDGAEYWEIGPNGRGRRVALHFGIWEGKRYSLFTHIYGGESTALVRVFEELHITEAADGVVMLPRSPGGLAYSEPVRILKDIPGTGLLDIKQLTKETASTIPSAPGTPVPGGELFVHGPGEDHMWLLLAGDSAVTYIIPHAGAPVDQVLEVAATLVATWKSG